MLNKGKNKNNIRLFLLSKSFSDILQHQFNSTDDGEYPKSFCLIKINVYRFCFYLLKYCNFILF